MRTYPRNSPQAAARIVALVLIADGHVDRYEDAVLEKLNINRELGLGPTEFAWIVQTLCEDRSIAHAPSMPVAAHADSATLDRLLAEIDDPVLRRKTMRLCVAVAAADDYLADGEIATLAAILSAWTLQPAPATPSRNAWPAARQVQARAAATTLEANA
ncbi:TerB family tellurite resistance protein [Paraburkholderia flava]|uniref:TerB family tellurite resistance protein n=1 Tax=Paraburkholderia flava TaxID=2547393 RepID=UPI00105F082E|nr:TerB family tellurite resistance protein [Paraburkholderia flava]